MMRVSQAAQALGASFHGGDAEFSAVGTDSRTLNRGELFVALRGERFDGHTFLAAAAAGGAAAALVEHADDALALPQIVVKDTTQALGHLGNFWRRRFKVVLVALTGSSGKTTVKEMLAAILRAAASDDAVLATRGNLNNHIGVPLTLLELRDGHRYAVVEMGMNHAGEIRYLTRLAEPDVALITNAGSAHLEYLGSVEAIARAKGEIFEGLKDDGTAVFNADDRFAPLWRELAAGRRRLEFGIETPAAAVTARYRLRQFDSEIVLNTPLGAAAATVPAPGLHNVRNALAAGAAASALQVPPATIAAGLARFGGSRGRLQRKRGRNGATVIDDTYNANPDSVRAAIDVLAAQPGGRILVLGDMGELGGEAATLHAAIGDYARNAGLDGLYTLGALSAHAAHAFDAAAQSFARSDDLIAALAPLLTPQTTLLVKGSRLMRMERVVEALTGATAEPH
ncbi:MAG TPA: UDP-N-acetylmuramoyl-tripeptide--D-alanyl-D-alanine ligase [Burkholderiales bacterium]|nr:UDP-N-acetylmuramoyl-tripeptide--D-alanyl-D-alanine ligase [Burkholderiales bacterium]